MKNRTKSTKQCQQLKITDAAESWVRLEPEKFAMRSERHTTTPTACMKSNGVE